MPTTTHASGPDRILGESDAAGAIRAFARKAAAIDAPVLITGETGTGKGLLARAIHETSARRARAFVAINCAGVPETLFESAFFGHSRGAFTGAQHTHRGFFEQAHGGSLLLDEVGELGPVLQAKLLTALEDGEVRRLGAERSVRVDTRVMAATSERLDEALARGRFRRDLFHRLCVLAFHLPPLRTRHGDVPFFARAFLQRFARRYGRRVHGFAPGTLERLAAYSWPGNIRELSHTIEAAVVACEREAVRVQDLPRAVRDALTSPPTPVVAAGADGGSYAPSYGGDGRRPSPDGTTVGPRDQDSPTVRAADRSERWRHSGRRYSFFGPPEEERRLIMDALIRCRGNKTRAARLLGMARNTLRQKIREHDIPPGAAPGTELAQGAMDDARTARGIAEVRSSARVAARDQ